MAVPANETSFNTRLYADSERTLPDSDLEVLAALESYGVVFKSSRTQPQLRRDLTSSPVCSGHTAISMLHNRSAVAVRLDLLAGLLWAHCHIKDVAPALADISAELQPSFNCRRQLRRPCLSPIVPPPWRRPPRRAHDALAEPQLSSIAAAETSPTRRLLLRAALPQSFNCRRPPMRGA